MSVSVVARPDLNLSIDGLVVAVDPRKVGVARVRISGQCNDYDCNDYDRATNAHFRSDKPSGATSKSLIVLNPGLTLNQRVPGSSPGAPTKLFKDLRHIGSVYSDKRSAAIPTSRPLLFAPDAASSTPRSAVSGCVLHKWEVVGWTCGRLRHDVLHRSGRCPRLR